MRGCYGGYFSVFEALLVVGELFFSALSASWRAHVEETVVLVLSRDNPELG